VRIVADMFLHVLQFCLFSIIPPVLLTHLHFITKLIRRDAGESLETKKSMPVRISVSTEKEFTFTLFLFGFVKVVARPQCRYQMDPLVRTIVSYVSASVHLL
jgi:hypothetical protein